MSDKMKIRSEEMDFFIIIDVNYGNYNLNNKSKFNLNNNHFLIDNYKDINDLNNISIENIFIKEFYEFLVSYINRLNNDNNTIIEENEFNLNYNLFTYKVSAYPILSKDKISQVLLSLINLNEFYKLNKNYEDTGKQLSSIYKEYNYFIDLIESAGLVHCKWDIEENKTIASKKYIDLFGYNPNSKNSFEEWFKRVPPEDRDQTIKNLNELLEGKTNIEISEYRYMKSKDEDYVWINAMGKIVEFNEDGKPKVYFGILQDITERKRTEEKLEASMKELENASQAKSQFVANMSHEIRTPMNAIIGLTHLALQTKLTERQKNYLKKIDFSAKSLLNIINEILDYSKIIAGKLNIEKVSFNIEKILDTIATLFYINAQDKGIEIIFNIDPNIPVNILGDPYRLKQIVTNLFSNAIKFTEKGEIELIVKIIEENEDNIKLQFKVRDTGIGISKEQQKKLFKSFSQADSSTTRKYGGTGLGLTITKSLIELMGGNISIESELNKGTIFTFNISFEKTENKEKSFLTYKETIKGKKILVCDDNDTYRKVIKYTLESFNFDVKIVKTGQEVIDELANNNSEKPYDLVLLDYNMPELDGIQTTKLIKSNNQITNTPIIVMVSAFSKEDVLAEEENIGVDAFLIKPLNHSTLFNSIINLVDKGKIIEENNSTISYGHLTKSLNDKRILLVEDNEINQLVAIDLLESNGVIVDVANNGKQALEIISENGVYVYDAILMDLQMPIMDSFSTTINIRNEYTEEEIIIIAMTADAMSGVYKKCIEVGMQDYITKPIDPETVFKVLNKWLNKSIVNRQIDKKEVNSNSDIPKFKNINTEDSLKRLGGNTNLYKKLLVKYYNNYKDINEEKIINLRKEDHVEFKRFFHSLKGVSGMLGANKIFKLVRELEEYIESKDETKVFEFLNKIELNLKETISELESYINEISD